MKKVFYKILIVSIVSIIFIYGFSGSYSISNTDNISYVTALGIDLSDDKSSLQVTFEFMDTSSFSTSGDSSNTPPIINTIAATSISSAINLLNVYVEKNINLSHCKVFVFSQELAKKGISSELTELMNNPQVRPTSNLIISKCSAREYVQNSTSSLEKILTKYYDIFPKGSRSTGYTANITIGNFYNNLLTKSSGNLAILGNLNELYPSESNSSQNSSSSESSDSSGSMMSSSSGKNSSSSSSEEKNTDEDNKKAKKKQAEKGTISVKNLIAGDSNIVGDRGTENIGLAVFNNGKYVGELNAMDTLCHLLIQEDVISFLLTIDNPEIYEHYIDVTLKENISPHISIDISNENPIININIDLTGRIALIKNSTTVPEENNIDLDKISNAVNFSLKNEILEYLNKTKNTFNCDVDNFYRDAKRKFKTIDEYQKYDWINKYKNCDFNVNVNSLIHLGIIDS